MSRYTQQQIKDAVFQIVADQFWMDQTELSSEKSFDELDADELDKIEVIMDLEDYFGIEFTDEQDEQIKSIGDIVTIINQHFKV